MSYNKPVLYDSIGTPRVWLYTPAGEQLLYWDNNPITKYLTSFKYTFDENNDDTCEIKFELENVRDFKLPYIALDRVLHVEWGYILEYNKTLSTYRYKIAIRDIRNKLTEKGIEVTLNCTDLVSYNKSLRVLSKNVWSNPAANRQVQGLKELRESWNRMMFDNIFNHGKTIETSTLKIPRALHPDVQKKGYEIEEVTTRSGKNYTVKTHYEYGENGEYQIRKEIIGQDGQRYDKNNYGIPQSDDEIVDVILMDETQRMNVSITGNRLDMLKNLLKLAVNPLDNPGGTVSDTTSSLLETKVVNFNQPIFREYIYAGGNGELISFNSDTKFNRIQVQKSKSAKISPLTKKMQTIESTLFGGDVNTTKQSNSKDWFEKWKEENPESNLIMEIKKRAQEKSISGEGVGVDIKQNIVNPTFGRVNTSSGNTIKPAVVEDIEYSDDYWLTTENIATFLVDYGIQDLQNPGELSAIDYLLNTMTDEQYAEYNFTKVDLIERGMNVQYTGIDADNLNNLKAQANKFPGSSVHIYNLVKDKGKDYFSDLIDSVKSSNYVVAQVLEKAMRKFEASARVIGDPSLIKGKLYNFINVGDMDEGIWYSKSVTHTINHQGYICEIKLYRIPKDVVVSLKQDSINPVFNEDTDELILEREAKIDSVILPLDNNLPGANVDNTVEALEKRLEQTEENFKILEQ